MSFFSNIEGGVLPAAESTGVRAAPARRMEPAPSRFRRPDRYAQRAVDASRLGDFAGRLDATKTGEEHATNAQAIGEITLIFRRWDASKSV